MSLILDALNKANGDETLNSGDMPNIHTSHDSSSVLLANNKSTFWLVGLVISLLSIIIALLVVLIFKSNNHTQTPPAIPEPLPAAQLPATPASSQVTYEAASQHRTPTAETLLSLSQPTATEVKSPEVSIPETIEPTVITELQTNRTEASETTIDPEVMALYTQSNQTANAQTGTPATQPKPVESASRSDVSSISHEDKALAQALWDASKRQSHTPLPATNSAKKTAPPINIGTTITPTPLPKPDVVTPVINAPYEETMAAYEKTPFLHELSTNIQNAIPTLMYSDHQYLSGYIVLNRQTLQAGEITNNGVRIDKILTDGTILKFNEKTFKLASMSSWVNY